MLAMFVRLCAQSAMTDLSVEVKCHNIDQSQGLPGAGILQQCLQAQLLCFSPVPTQFLHNCP